MTCSLCHSENHETPLEATVASVRLRSEAVILCLRSLVSEVMNDRRANMIEHATMFTTLMQKPIAGPTPALRELWALYKASQSDAEPKTDAIPVRPVPAAVGVGASPVGEGPGALTPEREREIRERLDEEYLYQGAFESGYAVSDVRLLVFELQIERARADAAEKLCADVTKEFAGTSPREFLDMRFSLSAALSVLREARRFETNKERLSRIDAGSLKR